MKNINSGTIKYLVVLIVSVALCGMILYPVFDLVYCKLISNSEFVYSFHKHLIQPILFAFIYGIVYWTTDKKRK